MIFTTQWRDSRFYCQWLLLLLRVEVSYVHQTHQVGRLLATTTFNHRPAATLDERCVWALSPCTMSNGGEDTASWRICRPEEGPPYFFNIQSGTTVWSLPDGLRLEDVPEFGVEDEVYDPTNTGSSSSSSSSSDDSGSSSSDDEEQADDGADAGASDGAVERAPVPQSVKPLLPPGAPLAMVAEGSDDSDDASDSGSAVAAVAAGAGAGAGAGAAVNGDDGVDTDESGEDDFHESKWDLPLGSTVCSLSLPKARWEKRLDTGSGETYFIDIETGETEWDTPDDYEDPDGGLVSELRTGFFCVFTQRLFVVAAVAAAIASHSV